MTKTTKTTEANNQPTKFQIKGKEHELKLTFSAIKTLNGSSDGGVYQLIGKALMGDIELYGQVVHAGLLHTGEGYSMIDVEEAIDAAFERGDVNMDVVNDTIQRGVLENPFYKSTVEKLLANSPEAKSALETIRGK